MKVDSTLVATLIGVAIYAAAVSFSRKEEEILGELAQYVKDVQDELKKNPNKKFPPLKNDTLLRVLKGEKVAYTPIWVHRQAGRYMHEFRAVRANHPFFEVCRTPALACEVTLQPIEAFKLDASIIFSDILVVLQAINLEVQMVKGKGPVVPKPLTSRDKGFVRLDTQVDVYEKLGYVFEAITLTRHALAGRVPLIGFTGAPWTLFCYAVEGQSSKTWSKAIAFLHEESRFCHEIFDLITRVNIDYLVGQVHAGAQVLEVFDSWAGILSPALFYEFCLPYVKRIVKQVKQRVRNELGRDIPMTLFAKGAYEHLTSLSQIGYDTLSVDWTITPAIAREFVGDRVILQGNLDPCALYASEKDLRRIVAEMMNSFGQDGLIANLGHGMLPSHDREKLKIFIDAVHNHQFHSYQHSA